MPDMRGLLKKFDIDITTWIGSPNGLTIVPCDVHRINDPQDKHANCEYFILDLYHDPYAAAALRAYAAACARTHPKLAQDLMRLATLTGKEGT